MPWASLTIWYKHIPNAGISGVGVTSRISDPFINLMTILILIPTTETVAFFFIHGSQSCDKSNYDVIKRARNGMHSLSNQYAVLLKISMIQIG